MKDLSYDMKVQLKFDMIIVTFFVISSSFEESSVMKDVFHGQRGGLSRQVSLYLEHI